MNFKLESWKKEFAESAAFYANNPKIAKNLRDVFPCPYSLEDAHEYIQFCIDSQDKQLVYAIVVDGKAVGSVGVMPQGDVYRKTAEVGYWLAEPYWGNGIVSDAVKQVCKQAFEKFGLVRIYAGVYADNIGSRKVLEKCGFILEGTRKYNVYKNGVLRDDCMYSLISEENIRKLLTE